MKRPDGVEIHWESRGEGPLVVLAVSFFGFPETFDALIGDLATDHQVVTYHVRGTGQSTRQGPYTLETDAADLIAVVDSVGGPAVVLAMGDGANRAVKAARTRPDLVSHVISPGGNPVGRLAAENTESLAGSESVLEALLGMFDTDYRSGLRTMIDSANPQLDDEGVRDRLERTVEHCPHEAAVPRLREWISDDAGDDARALGDRLWLLEHGKNPWFLIESARKTNEFLPEAHVVEVEDGPLSRPDIAAEVVRRVSAGGRAQVSSGAREQSV